MSVRKVYQLLLNGCCIASGSYASVKFAFSAVSHVLELLNMSDVSLVIAFQPK